MTVREQLTPDVYAKITEATAPKTPQEVPSLQPEPPQALEPQEVSAHLEETFKKLELKDKELRESRKLLSEQARQVEELKAKAELLERYEALKQSDPLGLISEMGFDLESVARAAEVRKSKDPDVIAAMKRVEAMERQLEATKVESERSKRAQDMRQLKSIVETRAEESGFDIITTLGLQNEVISVMDSIRKESNEPLTLEHLDQACKMVCDDIVGKFEKVKGTKYLGELSKKTEKKEVSVPEPTTKSLSNNMSVKTSMPASSDNLSRRERIQAAAALVQKMNVNR